MDLLKKPETFVNGHMAIILKRLYDGFEYAKKICHEDFFTLEKQFEFITVAHQRFLTQYCQERIYLTHKFDLKGIMLGTRLG